MALPDTDTTMSLEFHSATDTGRARNNNEDSVAIEESVALIVLADGMGGYNAGEVASGMATSFIKTELGRWLSEASDNASDTDVQYDGDPANWELGTLFASDRPVSVKLNSTVDPLKNVLLYFGTGRYISEADKTDPAQQYLYGIKDPFYNEEKHGPSKDNYYHNVSSFLPLTRGDLFGSSDVLVTTEGYVTGLPSGGDLEFSQFVQNMRLEQDGWFISLIDNSPDASERVITRSAILGGIVLTPTFTPSSDVCEMGGTTSLIGVYYETGTGYTNQIFDIDTLRQTNVTINNGDGTTTTSSQDVVEIRDDRLIRGTPAPKVVFHVGLEGGATSKLQMSNRSEGGGATNPGLYFRSTITEWWDNEENQ